MLRVARVETGRLVGGSDCGNSKEDDRSWNTVEVGVESGAGE